jgi:hypothetical protein
MGGMLPKLLQKAIDDGIIKPASKGRMMKAKYGKIIKAKRGMSFSEKMTLQDAKVIDKKTGKTHLSKNQLDDYLKNQKDPKLQKMGRLEKKYIQQRPGMAPKSLPVAKNILKAAKATRYGKIALGIAGAALGAKELLKSKMKKEDKKMAGGMAKKYSVGGGLDMGGPKGKLMAYAKENLIKDKDRLTLRDKAMIKTVMNMDKSEYPAAERYYKKLTSTKKMGGGMAKKYNRGGGADMGDPKKPTAIPKGKDSEVMIHNMMPSQTETGGRPLAAPTEVLKKAKAYYAASNREARKDLKPSQKKSRRYAATPGYLPKPAIGKMGGGMMNKPMGYKSGTMVKARGCKLGRTRPTKMY